MWCLIIFLSLTIFWNNTYRSSLIKEKCKKVLFLKQLYWDTFKLVKMDIKIFIQDMICNISVSSKNNTRFSSMSQNNNTRFILLSQNNNTRFSLLPARAQAKSGVILQQISNKKVTERIWLYLVLNN
jgi:hypothetical protein